MTRFGWSAKESSDRIHGLAKITALLFVVIYAVIYWFEPFSESWNVILSNLFLIVASSLTALIATLTWGIYDQTDTPRRVWGSLAIGLWLWAAAELTWGYLNVTQGEVAKGFPDVFWLTAYIFFGQALLFQYRILVQPNRRELWSTVLVVMFFLLTLVLLVYRVLTPGGAGQNQLAAVINSFYPAADFLLAVVALWLASHFIGGAFSRPWLGLLVFAFADLMYAWLEISGLYSWSVNQASLISTISDIVYLVAYLVLGLGVLSQWVFLKYGLRSPAEAR